MCYNIDMKNKKPLMTVLLDDGKAYVIDSSLGRSTMFVETALDNPSKRGRVQNANTLLSSINGHYEETTDELGLVTGKVYQNA